MELSSLMHHLFWRVCSIMIITLSRAHIIIQQMILKLVIGLEGFLEWHGKL